MRWRMLLGGNARETRARDASAEKPLDMPVACLPRASWRSGNLNVPIGPAVASVVLVQNGACGSSNVSQLQLRLCAARAANQQMCTSCLLSSQLLVLCGRLTSGTC